MIRSKLIFLVLFSSIVAITASVAHARTVTVNVPDSGCLTVRHLSVPGGNAVLDTFQAATFDSVTGNIWSFSGRCDTPPPIDPGAYVQLAITWLTHGDRRPHMIDVTRCENMLGRIDYTSPIVGWPYANGTTVQWQKRDNKYLRCRVHLPYNAGTLSHAIKVVSTGTTVPVRVAVVAPSMPWPQGPDTPCSIRQARGDQPVWINPGPPNSGKCSVAPGGDADLLVDANNGAFGNITISAN